jgi:signal transduction histidine kinase
MQAAANTRRWAVDAALALIAGAVELWLIAGDGDASTRGVVLTLAAAAALAARRAQPLVVLAVTLAAAIAIVAGGETPGGFCILIALYTVATTCPRRVSLAALVPTAAIVTGVSVATADAGDSAVAAALATAPVGVGIWGLGAYARLRRERAALVEREREQLARIAIHDERTAIARELHDIVAHSVTVMLVGVRGARDVLRASPEVADDTLARVEASGERSMAELRRLLGLLRRPEGVADFRPQPSLTDLAGLVASFSDAGLPVRLEVSGERPPLPEGVEVSVYRIVEEALTNVLKHADPGEVVVRLAYRSPLLAVEIVDDGVATASEHATGHGVLGMRERVALLDGELEAGSREGGGYRVAARLTIGDAR